MARDFRIFVAGMVAIMVIGLGIGFFVGGQQTMALPTAALPTATPDPWQTYAHHILDETTKVYAEATGLIGCFPLTVDTASRHPECIDVYDRVTGRASDLYWELEHHAWPAPDCAEDARDQLAFALDDLRNRPWDLASADLHGRLAVKGLFCVDVP